MRLRMAIKRYLAMFFAITAGLFVLSTGLVADQHASEVEKSDALPDHRRPLPAFSLQSSQVDAEISNEDLRGRYYVVNVWATWCKACASEHAFLNKLAQSGVSIVGLNYQQAALEVEQFLDDHGDPYQHSLLDQTGAFSASLGVRGMPETYLVNPEGQIIAKQVGRLTEQAWQNRFEPLLVGLSGR